MKRWILVAATCIVAAVITVMCTGCATAAQDSQTAIAADGATTAAALAQGATELNPLGFATIPIRLGLIEYAKTLPPEEGVPLMHMTTAVGWGAAASNLLFALPPPFGMLIGFAVGVVLWEHGAEFREFTSICESEKRRNPRITTCAYRVAKQ